MQITKQIINNLKMRSQLITFKLKTILLICLISFTSVLVRQTLQVQHSCNPMINWSGDLPAECQIAIKTSFENFDDFSSQPKKELKISKQQPQIVQKTIQPEPKNITPTPQVAETIISESVQSESQTQSNSVGQFIDEHSDDIVGVIAGTAVGVGSVAAASATAAFSLPVTGAVLVGLGIWYVIRTVL